MMINQCHPNKPREHNQKMPIPPPKERTAYGTYLYSAELGVLETFMRNYRHILTTHFQKNKNRRRRGILELQSGTRSQELELETLAAS
jgi:hypothetical protein